MNIRPQTIVVLAMSADGKISDSRRSGVLFGSPVDKAHLEREAAAADAIIVGAGTLLSGGTAMTLTNPELLKERQNAGKPPQPIQIICSRRGEIDENLKFFRQPVPRWLVTTTPGANKWQEKPGFDKILIAEKPNQDIDLVKALQQIKELGVERLAVLGGGEFISALLQENLIDELWLTVCPLIIGGSNAPTPVDGIGFITEKAPRLKLLEIKPVADEVLLHYRLIS